MRRGAKTSRGSRTTRTAEATAPTFFGTAGQRRRWKVLRALTLALYVLAGASMVTTVVLTTLGETARLIDWGQRLSGLLGVRDFHAGNWMITRLPFLLGATAVLHVLLRPDPGMIVLERDHLRVVAGRRTVRLPLDGLTVEHRWWPLGVMKVGFLRSPAASGRRVLLLRHDGVVVRFGSEDPEDVPDAVANDSLWEVPEVVLPGPSYAALVRELERRGVSPPEPEPGNPAEAAVPSCALRPGLVSRLPAWVLALLVILVMGTLAMALVMAGVLGEQALPVVSLLIVATWFAAPTLFRRR